MRRRVGAVLLTAALLAVPTHAASTKYRSSWKSPDAASVDLRGQKVVAMVIRKDDLSRRDAEHTLAGELTARGMQGIAAYMVVPADELRNRDAAKARMEKAEIAAVVVMREVGQSNDLSETAATYYVTHSFSGYDTFWGSYTTWSGVYDPGYVSMDRIITVETLVYDLRRDKLVWAGMSESTNPKNLVKLLKDLVATTAKEMQKQGLVRPRP